MSPSFLWGEFSGPKRSSTITPLMFNSRDHQKRSPTHHKSTIPSQTQNIWPIMPEIVIIDEINIFEHTQTNNKSNHAPTTPHYQYYTENAKFGLYDTYEGHKKHYNGFAYPHIPQKHQNYQNPQNSNHARKVKCSEKSYASNCITYSPFAATLSESIRAHKGILCNSRIIISYWGWTVRC